MTIGTSNYNGTLRLKKLEVHKSSKGPRAGAQASRRRCGFFWH